MNKVDDVLTIMLFLAVTISFIASLYSFIVEKNTLEAVYWLLFAVYLKQAIKPSVKS